MGGRGAKEWFEGGLRDPACVLEATKTYRREEDVLADFIESKCVIGPSIRRLLAICTLPMGRGARLTVFVPGRKTHFHAGSSGAG